MLGGKVCCMNGQDKSISKEELRGILGSRVTMDPNANQKRLHGKEINDPIVMQDRLSNNLNTYIKDLTFDECIFNEDVNIGSYEKAGNVTFYNCIFNKSIGIEFRNSSFTGNCVVNSDLRIQASNDETEISEIAVKGTLEVLGSPPKLTLKNINHGQDIKDQKIKISAPSHKILIQDIVGKQLEFSDHIKFVGELIVKNVEVSELVIGAIVLDTEMIINDCNITKFQIGNLSGNTRALIISDSVIGEMKLNIGTLKKTSIKDGSINNLQLHASNEKENILNIEKATIVNLKFENVFNNGLITLRELRIPPNGLVSFKSSNLGKADFIYCNFSKAILEFENSKITEAFFSETEFPKKVLVNGKKNYGQAQLTFGQLATAFQKQGDNIRALEYNSRELEAHYRTLKWLSPNFFHKLNLWLNAISNNFGRYWMLGVLFSFGIGLLFFCFLLVSTHQYKWGVPSFDWNLLPAYLKFMNPLRFFELEALFNNTPKEGSIKLNGLSYLADFGGRIFVAYGYYQTIQAFRRFGRK